MKEKLLNHPFYTLAMVVALGTFFSSLIVQFVFELYPCPLCILQRVLYMLIGLVLLLGFFVTAGRQITAFLGLLLAVCTMGVAIYQGWLASPEALSECGAPGPMETTLWWLAENISYPVFAPEASCADAAQHNFLYLPMPLWSLLSGGLIAVSLALHLKKQ